MQIRKLSIIALSALLLTTGCSDVKQRATATLDKQDKNAEAKLEDIRNMDTDAKDMNSVRHSDRIWLGSRGYRQQNGDPLPNKYDHITYMTTERQSLSSIASDLSAMTGMRFVVRDVENALDAEASDDALDIEGNAQKLALSYSGDFVGLLNQISTKFDMFWEHRENVIYLSKYVTRTLALHSLPSITTLQSEITSESDSSEGEEGESQTQSGTDNTVELETSLDVWAEIEEVIKSMLPEGSTYAVSPSIGTLTITSSPLAIRKVENLIKKQNEIISRQVVIDINVMTIVMSEMDSFQLEWDALLSDLSDNYGFDWISGSGNLTALPTGSGVLTNKYVSDSGNNTVDAVLDSLSERFNRSNITNSTVTTLNNHTVPLQIITRQSYLKEMETTISSDFSTTAATPGDVTTGFVMNILPRILANGEIMMQYSMSLSELTELAKETFGTDDTSFLQLPTVVSRDFLQTIKLKSGNTLVLAGYDRLITVAEDSGVGHPDNFILGGGKYGSIAKEVLVITITPRVIM